jgi:predicted Zn-dependent protease
VLGDPQMAQQVLGAASQALQLLTLKHSRDDEREADLLGVGYAAQRGYQVAEGAEFFNSLKRLGAKDGVKLPAWASTHPDPGEREQTIVQLGKKYQQTKGLAVLGEDELLSSIQGMVVGENPREGFTQNGIFYHPEMKFQFAVPQGWKVRNEKSAVLLTTPNRNAAMVLELARAGSAREAASQFASQQGLQVIESGPARLRGLDAYQVVGQAQTQQGAAGIVNYFIEHEGRVFSFMGLTGASNLRQQQAAFERAVSGFRKVTDPKVLQVRPMRLQIVTADRTAPFSSFLPTSATPGITPEELAILNQVTLSEQIPAGTKLKLPR